jgi:hypothetical protein
METIVKEGITSHRSKLTSNPYIPVVYITTNKNTYRMTFFKVQHNILNEFDLHFILTDWNEKLYKRNRYKDWMWWNNPRFGSVHFGKYLDQSSYETFSKLTTSKIFDSYNGSLSNDFDSKDYVIVRSAIQYNIETYGIEQFFNSLEWKLF